jgi:phosphatidylserine/phosphatidylglycerophosphate/cardiolipin synthase-like enzyme
MSGKLRDVARLTGPLARLVLRPFHRRRTRRALAAGRVDAETLAHAEGEWWGSDRRWYPGGTPPRRYNRVTPLIDGAAFFDDLLAELGKAQSYVYIANWCLTAHVPLRRCDDAELARSRLVNVLGRVGERARVRVLLWAGSPAVFPPNSRLVAETRRAINGANGDVRCELDDTAPFSHCHHQKAIVVDGRVAYLGGMDLTTYYGDRWDTPEHPPRFGPSWHDVVLRIEREAVPDVEQNFRERWGEITGEHDLPRLDPPIGGSWDTPVQIVRTIPRKMYDFAPRGEFGIYHSHLEALRAARHLIYLENQYLWAPDVIEILEEHIAHPPSDRFRIVIVLPAQAQAGKWDNDEHVDRLRKADRGRGIVSIYCTYSSGAGTGETGFVYKPIYVHAKVTLVDDEWLSVGSANLNNRGFVSDSEINAVVKDAEVARDLRLALWAEHLCATPDRLRDRDPVEVIDLDWPTQAAENKAILRAGDRPLLSRVVRYERGSMPGVKVLEEMENLALDL